MIKEVQKYVPGYRLVNGLVFDGNRVSVFLEVEGGRLPAQVRRQPGHHDRRRRPHRREMFARRDARRPPDPETHCCCKEPDMELKGKKITVHDMTLRDGMHPKRHLMSLEQMKRSPPARRCRRPADRSHPRRRPGGSSRNYGFPAHTDEEYLCPPSSC